MLDDSSRAIAARLRKAMEDAGISNTELANATDVSVQGVGDWLRTGRISREKIVPVARAVGISCDKLLTGEDFQERSTASLPSDLGRPVPIIPWAAAGTWSKSVQEQLPNTDWLPCPAPSSPDTYGLRVEGDSMTAPHGRSYPDAAIIFVDPDQARRVVNGDSVIAKLQDSGQVTFKLLVADGAQRYLRSLNPAYLPITTEFRVLGKVIGTWVAQ